jgi:hypothetical protein
MKTRECYSKAWYRPLSLFHQQTEKKKLNSIFVDLVGRLILHVSPFLLPTGNFKQ